MILCLCAPTQWLNLGDLKPVACIKAAETLYPFQLALSYASVVLRGDFAGPTIFSLKQAANETLLHASDAHEPGT